MEFTEPWHHTVVNDHLLWSEYGCGIDLYNLPAPMYEAHIAILRGIQDKRRDENDKAERKRKRAKRNQPNGY